MIRIYDDKAPVPRVFEHYWQEDKHTDHLNTNPVCRGQYEKYYSYYFKQETQRARAIGKRILQKKIRKLENQMSMLSSMEQRFGKQFQMEVLRQTLELNYPYYMPYVEYTKKWKG